MKMSKDDKAFAVKLGNKLRQLRFDKGLSQEKLGFKTKLDRTYISAVERGRRNITIISLRRILKALDISIEEFFHF